MSIAELLAKRFAANHRWILEALDTLDDTVLRTRLGPRAPSIGFHVWHVARWADRVQARFGSGPEIWHRDDIARSWGLDDRGLGEHATGMGLDDEASAALTLPARALLMTYAREAFAAADHAAAAVRDGELERVIRDHYDKESSKAQILISHAGHASRHLGMIEALRGVGGQRGTATL